MIVSARCCDHTERPVVLRCVDGGDGAGCSLACVRTGCTDHSINHKHQCSCGCY